MRDAGESSESEKSWGSDDEPANEHPSRVATRGRHVPPVQQIQPESEPSMDCSEPTTTDPLEEEEDPWCGMQDPWANGRDPWSGGGSQGGSANSTAPDPRDGQDRAKPNPGAQAGDPWDHGNDPWSKGRATNGKGTAPAKGRGKGKESSSTEDPWTVSDPWAEAAGKGKTVPRPKPPPPKPPSSDGEEPQNTWSRAASGVGTAGQSRQRGVDGEKKIDYLDYAKRCFRLGAAQSRCCAVEVQPNKKITLPGFLRCELGETLLLRFVRDDFALLEDFPSKTGQRMGWVPLDSMKPVEPYDFQVKVVREPGSRLGLLGEELDFPDDVTRIMVVKVDEQSVLSAWNDRCRECHPRDQILPGDLIIAVNHKTDLESMFEQLSTDGQLLFLVLRHEQRLHPSWASLAGHELEFLGKGDSPPTGRAQPEEKLYREIEQFQ